VIPRRLPGQTLAAHQAEMARWLGHESVDAMNAAHDPLHHALCAWLGIESQSLRQSAGEELTNEELTQAAIEENAVLWVQKLACVTGVEVPR
jgi:hypothetical protein